MNRLPPLTLLPLLLLGACSQPTPPASPSPSADSQPDPHHALASMDTRAPVPLQPRMAWHQKQNMMQHLEAIEAITAALAENDFAAVAEAAEPIQSSPQMQQQCEHMGAGADGFTELALSFHEAADRIAPAAEQEDAQAVLQATAATLAVCTRCHQTYRQEVVDADTFTARTGSEHTPRHHD